MKRIVYIAVIGASLIAASLPAARSDAGRTARILAPGYDSCGAWSQGREAAGTGNTFAFTLAGSDRLARESWVNGYISAFNEWLLPYDRGVARDLSEGTDAQGLMAWIDNYCSAHPLDQVVDATAALATELATEWIAAHPPSKKLAPRVEPGDSARQ